MECVSDIANRFLFPGIEKELFGYLYDPSLSFEEKVHFCGDTPMLWPLFEKEKGSNDLLYCASKYNHFPLILRAIELGADNWNWGMFYAAEGGHLHLVEYFIEKGADDWDSGMEGAAQEGYLYLVEYFVEKGADDWNRGMESASIGGQLHIVEYFKKKLNQN